MMIAYPVGRTRTFAWALSAHQNAASMFSSLVSVCALITVCIMLNLVNYSSEETALSMQRDIVDEYLTNNKGNASQAEISYCFFLLATLPKHSPSGGSQESFAALISLMVSFALGVMILVVLSAITLVCYPRRRESEEASFAQKRASRGYRLLSLGLMLRRYHVRLVVDDECENNPDKIGDGRPSWMIPKPGIPNDDTEHPRRILSDKCPICLDEYNLNEKVAYSSNKDCFHVFHEACIRAWMLPQATANQQCPCCRQTFLSILDCPEVTKKIS